MRTSARLKKTDSQSIEELRAFDPAEWLPPEIGKITDHQTDLPRIAKDPKAIAAIESRLSQIPTSHDIHSHDSRRIDFLAPNSIHLVLTSPPYWTLKDYREHPDQMGYIADYEEFLAELDRVWQACYDALVPGGRVVCVVGDVCLSRRKNEGEHTVVIKVFDSAGNTQVSKVVVR